MSVAELLAQSRQAHQRSFQSRGRINKQGTVSHAPTLTEAGAQIREALRLRTEAHALDPQQADAAWLADRQAMKGQPSDALLSFYVGYLSR